MPRRTISPRAPTDIAASIAPQTAGGGDPSFLLGRNEAVMALLTEDGPATLHLSGAGDLIEAEAWGAGADCALEMAPGIVGADDDPAGFRPDARLARLARKHAGLRITASRLVVPTLLRTIPAQKVTTKEAKSSYRRLARTLGEKAPGPHDLLLPPDPDRVADMGYAAFHPMGIERTRAVTMIEVARRRNRLEAAAAMPLDDAYRRLQAIRGVGPWTTAIVGATALGDPDAVPTGDYHLPNTVSWALAGEPRGDDDRMLELLAPYAGHRARVIRLVKAAGVHAPRYGPKTPVRSYDTF